MQITATRDLRLLQWKIIKKQPSVNALTYGDVAVTLCALHRLVEKVRSSSPPPAPYPGISHLEKSK